MKLKINAGAMDIYQSAIESFVKIERTKKIVSLYFPTLLMQTLFVAVTCWVLYDFVSDSILLIWALSQLLVLTLRWLLMHFRSRLVNTQLIEGHIEVFTIALVVTNSVLWGLTAFTLNFQSHPNESVFIIILNFGIGIGAIGLGSYWFAYFLFYLLTFMGMFVSSLAIGVPEPNYPLALLFVFFAIFICRVVFVSYSNNLDNLRLRKQNELLAQSTNQFIAAASHDLRQPAQALSFLISALSSKKAPSDQRPIIKNLKQSANSLNDLLNQILDISRFNDKNLQTHLEVIGLRDLFNRLEQIFGPHSEQKGLALSFKCEDIYLKTDPLLLERLLSNLIDNAIHYTKRGKVDISATSTDGVVNIRVKDTGIGISDSELFHVFDAFYQVGNEKREVKKGVGLGLSIVRLIADKLDINLELESFPSKGTIFTLSLSETNDKQAHKDTRHSESINSLCGRRVMVVDDNEAIIDSLEVLLSSWEMQVYSAKNYDTAMQISKSIEAVDLLLVDFRLDENRTGIELVKEIKQLWQTPDIPVLLLTGDSLKHPEIGADSKGITVLNKPIKPAILRNTVQRYLCNFKDTA